MTIFVKTFFLTLSHKDIGTITMMDVVDRLKSDFLFGNQFIKVMGVVELHDNGKEHFHFLIISKDKGLSKNTYRNDFRRAFPEMTGMGLDVKGVKNVPNVLKYILKFVDDMSKILLVNLTVADLRQLVGNNDILLYLRIKA